MSFTGAPKMKSIHPPLYVLVASVAFFFGANLDLSDSANSSDASPFHESNDLGDRQSQAENQIENIQLDQSREGSAASDGTQLAQTNAAGAQKNVRRPALSQATLTHGPILKTKLGDVEIFPVDNPWNTEITDNKVHPDSKMWLKSIGLNRGLHPDFGTVWNGAPNGIPYVVVAPGQPKVWVSFLYDAESDVGPYPIPRDVPIEGGRHADEDTDRHVILIDPQRKLLYELFHAYPNGRGWKAGSGAIFDLTTNKTRPKGWTSADAAGLPVFPGLVRYDEVAAGQIRHALRFTVSRTQRGYIFPARHFASRSTERKLPPMGLRVRLKADYDISRFPKSAQVILTALKNYGMLLADNGSDWFLSGAPDPRWSDGDLATLKRVKGSDLECIITGPIDR